MADDQPKLESLKLLRESTAWMVDWAAVRIFTLGRVSLLQLLAFVAGIALLAAAVMQGHLGPR